MALSRVYRSILNHRATKLATATRISLASSIRYFNALGSANPSLDKRACLGPDTALITHS